jgi:pimeloyl-ACP methyl ester carboxylesterase
MCEKEGNAMNKWLSRNSKIILGLLVVIVAASLVIMFAGRAPDENGGQTDNGRGQQQNGKPVKTSYTQLAFIPASGGYHTCWLIAGPFPPDAKNPPKPEEAREGKGQGASGWKLLSSAESILTSPPGMGRVIVCGQLKSNEASQRILRIVATAKPQVSFNSKVLEGQLTNNRGVWRFRHQLEVKPGLSPIAITFDTKTAVNFSVQLKRNDSLAIAMAIDDSYDDAPEHIQLELLSNPQRSASIFVEALKLSAASSQLLLTPGNAVKLRLAPSTSIPDLKRDLTIELTTGLPGLKPVNSGSYKVSTSALVSGQQLATLAPKGTYVSVNFAVKFFLPGSKKPLAEKSCKLFSISGIRKAALQVSSQALTAGAKIGMNKVALPLLKAEKTLLMLSSLFSGSNASNLAANELEGAVTSLAAVLGGKDPLAGKLSWVERAYWSEIDNSAQPYRLHIPRIMADPAIQEAGKVPLLVYLHGWVPSYDKHEWVEENEMEQFTKLTNALDCIVLIPFGRSNTDFASVGEVDVLRSIEETCRHYPIDRDKIYLCGYSMGGYGAYLLVSHYPGRFAGCISLAGRPEPYYIEQERAKGMPYNQQPAYKRFCLDLDNPMKMAGNFQSTPVLILQGKEDTVIPISSAQRILGALKKASAPASAAWVDGDHWSIFDALTKPDPFKWLTQLKKITGFGSLKIKTYSPRYGKNKYAQILTIDKWTAPAMLSAELDEERNLTITTKNVREFILSDVPGNIGLAKLGATGHKIVAIRNDNGSWQIHGRLATAPKNSRWSKNALLPGPMKEACNTPFTIVFDAPGRQLAATPENTGKILDPASTEAMARRFAAEWAIFAKGRPPVKCESELTAKDMLSRSLILFCQPSRSKLFATVKETLQCKVTDDSFEICGRKFDIGPDSGLLLTRPSPWAKAKNRYLVVATGQFYGQGLASNHKLDLVPDYILFTSGTEGQGEPPALVAGFFNSDWQADPELLEVFKP